MSLINTKLEKDNIYIIELNNPKKRNPLSLGLIKSLQNEFDYINCIQYLKSLRNKLLTVKSLLMSIILKMKLKLLLI